jgi:hypothetical protein
MSEQSQGPGWWLASDGKWYPPDQAPAVPPPETWAEPSAIPPPGPPPSSGMSTGAKVAIAVVAGLGGLIVLSLLAVMLLGQEAETTFSRTGTVIDGGDSDDGGDGDGGEPADAPDGFTTIEGDGVSIAALDGWEEIAPDDFSMTPEEFEAAFPDAPPELLEQATTAFAQGAKLIAFDVEDPEFSSNVNIASFPGEAPLSLLESQATNQLETLGGTVISSEQVTVPAGDAVRVEYTLDVAGPAGGAVTANGVQYYVHAGGSTYVVTVTTLDDAGELADSMIETLRVD